MSLPAGARLGHYEILGHIGSGGMGEVYRAKDTKLARGKKVDRRTDLWAFGCVLYELLRGKQAFLPWVP